MASKARHPLRRSTALASRQAVVERAEAYVRSRLGTPVPVSRLCVVLGISERGLRNAFYGVRGLSPKRSMLAMRLQGARRALSPPEPPRSRGSRPGMASTSWDVLPPSTEMRVSSAVSDAARHS